MRLAALIILMLLTQPLALAADISSAILNKVGFDRLQSVSEELEGPDAVKIAEKVLSGELRLDGSLPKRVLEKLVDAVKDGLFQTLSILAIPVLATLCLKLTMGRDESVLTLLCRLACACGLTRSLLSTVTLAEHAMRSVTRLADAVSPVLAATLTLTGSGAMATALTPLSTLCVGIIENGLLSLGLPLCGAAGAIAACGSLSDQFRLDRLFTLLCRVTVWGVKLAIAGFVALLAVEGRLAAVQDTASSQAVGQALRGLIPFIGGSVSDSAGAIEESAFAVRNTVGITGLAIILAVCARPAAKLTVHMLSLQLASAIIEPVADPGIVRIAAGFGEVTKMLLALCVGSLLLAALLTGTCLGLIGTG